MIAETLGIASRNVEFAFNLQLGIVNTNVCIAGFFAEDMDFDAALRRSFLWAYHCFCGSVVHA